MVRGNPDSHLDREQLSSQQASEQLHDDMAIVVRILPLVYPLRDGETAEQVFERVKNEVPELEFLDRDRVETAMESLMSIIFELETNGRPSIPPGEELGRS